MSFYNIPREKIIIDYLVDLDDSQLIMLGEIIKNEINQRKRDKIKKLKSSNSALSNHSALV